MTGSFHTLTYPTHLGAVRQGLALPEKTPADIRSYVIDFADFVDDAKTTVSDVTILVHPSLSGGEVAHLPKSVSFTLAGGSISIPLPAIVLVVQLANGDLEQVTLVQPIDPVAPAIPDGAITLGSIALTSNFSPIELTDLVALPGGPASSDLLVLLRPGAPALLGVVPWAALPSGGGSSSLLLLTAGASISGHRAIMVNGSGLAVHADPTGPFAFLGISTGAVTSGGTATIAPAGQTIVEPSWSWTPGAPLYVGPSGVLTATPPTSGVLQRVAEALSATSILVQPFAPIRLT